MQITGENGSNLGASGIPINNNIMTSRIIRESPERIAVTSIQICCRARYIKVFQVVLIHNRDCIFSIKNRFHKAPKSRIIIRLKIHPYYGA